jgi:hypothetical protein
MFVSGPVAIKVTALSLSLINFAIKSTACKGDNSIFGSGSSAPSSADSPCISLASSKAPRIDLPAPSAIGTSIFAKVAIRLAFKVTLEIPPLPETVVIPNNYKAGFLAARIMARASSWPGSQSRIIGKASMRQE